MFGSESDFDEPSGLLRSGKRYKINIGSYALGQSTEYTQLSPEYSKSKETPSIRNPPITPQRRSVIPENLSQSSSNPSPSNPVAGQSTMAHMNDDIKLPVFKGTGSEDPEQFWFLCEAVWTAKNIMD